MFLKKKSEHQRSFALIQGGLNEHAPTDILLDEVARMVSTRGITCDRIDVRQQEIDFWDGRPWEKYSSKTQEVGEKMKRAQAYIFSIPVYAASLSGAIKNIIKLTEGEMKNKVAGIMACSSGVPPYPATHELIGILSQAPHVSTVQPVVYSSPEEFKNGKIFDEQITLLIEEMVDALIKRCIGHG